MARQGRHIYRPRKFELDDLDRAILAMLPNEGSKLGKYLNDGLSVKGIAKSLSDTQLPTSVITGRMNSLRFQGMVVGVKGTSREDVRYQVTQKGKDSLAKNGKKVSPE
jgi:hypothetical protein